MQLVLDPADRIVLCVARAFERFEEGQEIVLERREFEEIMFLVAELRLCPADLADRVLDLARLKVLAAALVALVPPCLLAAIRTGALHVPIREETPALRAVCLVDDLHIDIAVFHEPCNDLPSPVMVHRVVGHAEIIEVDPDPLEGLIEVPVIPLGKRPGRGSLLFCRDHDRRPMVVRARDKHDLFTHPPHVADVTVGGDVRSQMTKMAGPVRVREPAGNQQRWFCH